MLSLIGLPSEESNESKSEVPALRCRLAKVGVKNGRQTPLQMRDETVTVVGRKQALRVGFGYFTHRRIVPS